MSFIGSIPAGVRKVIADHAEKIDIPVLIIGAGNFTAASALRSGGYTGPIHACDISMYTSALGAYLSDSDFKISESECCPQHLQGFFSDKTLLDTVASISLLYDLREVWQQKNKYQERVITQYRLNWPGLMKKTKDKLESYKKHLSQIKYSAKDGFEVLEESDRGSYVFAFPPTYKAGYEKLEKLLRAALNWEYPVYREMTDQDTDLYRLIKKFAGYCVILEKDMPAVHDIIGAPAVVLPRGRAGLSHIIMKDRDKKIIVRRQIKSAPVGPYWPSDQQITGNEDLSFKKMTLPQTIRMNELFLSSRIDYFTSGVSVSLAFTLDGQVFGKVDFTPSSHQWKLPEEKPMIYIMSDLAVPSSEKRLAKLVLLCLLSTEIKEILDHKYVEDYGWAVTSAFSQHPVSMKYRGVFKLHTRKETNPGFLLNYYAPFHEKSLSEILAFWRKKYNK